MPRSRNELTAGEWAVLALLAEAPSHGFAVARVMAPDGEVGRVWSVRRPLVYRAAETLTRMDLVRPAGTEPSRTGPAAHRPHGDAGRQARGDALAEDARRARARRALAAHAQAPVPRPLRRRRDAPAHRPARRVRRARRAPRARADAAEGFERALALWRLETTTAAARFVETMLAQPVPAAHAPRRAPVDRAAARG
jgi:hypothetical protein